MRKRPSLSTIEGGVRQGRQRDNAVWKPERHANKAIATKKWDGRKKFPIEGTNTHLQEISRKAMSAHPQLQETNGNHPKKHQHDDERVIQTRHRYHNCHLRETSKR